MAYQTFSTMSEKEVDWLHVLVKAVADGLDLSTFKPMIRIEENENGVLFVVSKDGQSQYEHDSDLDPAILSKLQMLRAVDVGVKLNGIGRKVRDGTYWIEEGPLDDSGDINGRVVMYSPAVDDQEAMNSLVTRMQLLVSLFKEDVQDGSSSKHGVAGGGRTVLLEGRLGGADEQGVALSLMQVL